MDPIENDYDAKLGLDQNGNRVINAEADVYAASDTTFSTPLAITDSAGIPLDKLRSNSDGIYPGFRVPSGVLQVNVKSGDRVTPMTSLAVYAKVAAQMVGEATALVDEATANAGVVAQMKDEVNVARSEVLAVGNTNDTIIEGRIKDPASKTAKALGDRIVSFAGAGIDQALSVLDMRLPSTLTVAIASDSTADGTNEWYELAWQSLFASLWPDRPARVIRWNKANDAYVAPIIWQTAETPAVPPSGETTTPNQLIGQDGFDSASPVELNGRAPNIGAASAAWTATPGAFKVASGVIYSTATSGSGFNSYFNIAARNGINLYTRATVRWNSTPSAATRSCGLYGPYITSANRVIVNIQRNTTGSMVVALQKTIGGTSTTIATFPAGTIPENTVGDYAMSITVTGTGATATVSATVNGQTVSGTLTEADVTALTGTTRGGFVASVANDPDFAFSNYEARGTVVTAANPGTPAVPSPLPYATVYNPSAAGETAAYQQARLNTMYPVRPDILMIAHGHNYGSQSPIAYLAGIDAFVDAFLAKWPGVPVWAVSQNPEFAGNNIAAHGSRQAALRSHARERGWGYIPAFEAFSQRDDGGKSYVNADGIHPVTLGQSLWRDVAKSAVKARSART